MNTNSSDNVKSANDLNYPIVLSDGMRLPLLMVRADILVPVLELDGIEEDLALDLHYSLEKKRVWDTSKVKYAANLIYKKLLHENADFAVQIKERLPECYPDVVASQWLGGFKILCDLENLETLSWERL